jgi:hypothetical protein
MKIYTSDNCRIPMLDIVQYLRLKYNLEYGYDNIMNIAVIISGERPITENNKISDSGTGTGG